MSQSSSLIHRVLFIMALVLSQIVWGQENVTGTKLLDQYIESQEIALASEALDKIVDGFKTINAVDSLHPYPYYIAKIQRLKGDLPKALRDMAMFVQDMEKAKASEKSLYLAKISMAEFYDEVGENQKSFDITQQGLAHVLKADNVTPEDIGKMRYNLGACYMTLDNIPEAKNQFQDALKDYEGYTLTSKKGLSDGYNAMGAMMWLSTKLDSAKYFYKKASETIKIANGDSIENLHYATVIQSNVSLLEYSQGNMSNALEIQKEVIKAYEKVIKQIGNPELKSRAQRYQTRAISNLSTFYNEMGNLSKANEILYYAYGKQQVFLEPNDDGLATVLIQIGQSELSLRSYQKGINSLKKGLKIFEDKGADRPYWKAAAYHALGRIYEESGRTDSAAYYYKAALPSFEKALGENIDKEYLTFLRSKAHFESREGLKKDAVFTAQKAYKYVVNQGGEDSFEISKQMLSLAEVYLNIEEYDKAEYWSAKGDDLLRVKSKMAKEGIDAVKLDFNRPLLLLVKAKAAYKSMDATDVNVLMHIQKELDTAVTILERRKESVYSGEDIDQLLFEYKAVNEFSKRLNVELYKKTTQTEYLSALMTAQEAGVYNRIRAKLSKQQSITSYRLPEGILKEEERIREGLSESFNTTEASAVLSYFEFEKQWVDYLDKLKIEYPEYYKLRYATIEIPIDEISNQIPEETTVIRYFFIENELYAFVANTEQQELIALPTIDNASLNERILGVIENQFQVDILLKEVHELYKQLWEPLLKSTIKENVIIIPDKALYNLSFEMLTSSKLEAYTEFDKKSLLAKHNIAYNFSLLLTSKESTTALKDNFIAFTPEFSEEMKQEYKIAIQDSLDMDHTYLTLLPQPFSESVAENYNRIFKGSHFKNKEATKQLFIDQAKEHKIIHIGTHAESNNVSPELSRLIFAKPLQSKNVTEDNSLYTYEIYNCDLTSNLAILTACETGKPSYQAGEGMISLAHAFTYAGSESILTSLWKIDEQSSAQIVSYFYNNLEKGMPKDRALRAAKLEYLNSSQGRTLQPNYWAGLILMGDTAPLELKNSTSWWMWVWIAIGVLCVLYFVLKRKRTH